MGKITRHMVYTEISNIENRVSLHFLSEIVTARSTSGIEGKVREELEGLKHNGSRVILVGVYKSAEKASEIIAEKYAVHHNID